MGAGVGAAVVGVAEGGTVAGSGIMADSGPTIVLPPLAGTS